MPLPDGPLNVVQGGSSRPAYLIRFPEDVWTQLEKSATTGQGISVDLNGHMRLNIPGIDPIPLTIQPSGTTSEIYLSSQDTLTPHATASSRLNLPISSAVTSKAADKLKAQNEAHDLERKHRADRLNGIRKPIPPALDSTSMHMGRTVSSPAMPQSATGSTTPMIPLKTRVVQLLALGPLSLEEIVSRVGMTEGEVVRVVKGVGRETPEGYGLQPAKYSGVKIATWPYTYMEKQRVIQLAKKAFDELGYPEDADERAELDRKEAEVMSGGSSASENVQTPPPIPSSVPAPAPTPIHLPSAGLASAPTPTPPKKEKSAKKGALGLIGKQRAKFQAEKRAASLPNVKKIDGTASPRTEPAKTVDALSTKESKAIKRKRDEEQSAQKRRASPKRSPPPKAASPASTHSSGDSRGRSKTTKTVSIANAKTNGKKKSRLSRDYSSSENSEEESIRSSVSKLPKIPRKPPPPKLELSATANANAHRQEIQPPDPEAMRERYEELFPAYELLSRKLATLHRDAEGEEEGEVVELRKEEMEKMITRWQKWHNELEKIRTFFAR